MSILTAGGAHSRRRARWKRELGAWLVMLPGLLLFAFFIWEPLVEALRLSLYEANGIRIVRFVGLDNFRSVLAQPDFWPAVGNTFRYLLWSLAIGFLLPIVLAVFIQESVRGKGLYRTAIYLPNIVPSLATFGLDSEMGRVFAVLAIGAGSIVASHANDSYFWVVTKFSEIEMEQSLRVFTTSTIVMGLTSFVCIWAASLFFL